MFVSAPEKMKGPSRLNGDRLRDAVAIGIGIAIEIEFDAGGTETSIWRPDSAIDIDSDFQKLNQEPLISSVAQTDVGHLAFRLDQMAKKAVLH